MQKSLITLLAEVDALFEPIRDWSSPPNVIAILERRDDYYRLGLPCPRGGGDAGERQKFSRQMDVVERSGRVIFHRTNGTRTHWKLPNAVDWKLRSVGTGWRFADCLAAMLALRELTDAGCTNDKCVPDWEIVGATVSEKADRILDLEAILAPALCRGWVSAWSDGQGRNGYHLRAAGREFLDQPIKPPIESSFEPATGEAYLSAFDSARKNLRTLKPRHESCIPIPLGAGDWPGSACRKHIPAIFDSRGNVRTPAAMTAAIAKSRESSK